MTSATQGSSLKPLLQEAHVADELAPGVRLLGQVGPMQRSEHRKRRVWNALNTGAASRLGFRLTTLHVAFASLLVAAVSSAAGARYYVTQSARAVAPAPAVEAPARRAKPATPRKAAPPRPVVATSEVAPPEAPAAAALGAAAHARADVAARAARPSPADPEAQLLVEAMRARSSGDAKRVSQLVDEYRTKHPQGALQEEALILSIESAVSRHAPNAAALGREYLSRFPNGRFAEQARRAINLESR